MLHANPTLGGNQAGLWFGIAPISAGVFGVPVGLLANAIVSLLTPAPDEQSLALLRHIRTPGMPPAKM
jgi:cation/acetate symporter